MNSVELKKYRFEVVSTGRMAIYYGGADTVTCLTFTQVDEIIGFIKSNSKV